MFPRQIPSYLIDLACPKDGIVLDPFMGSGTTIRECIHKGVGFLGFETNNEYYEMCLKSAMNEVELKNTNDYELFINRYEDLCQ